MQKKHRGLSPTASIWIVVVIGVFLILAVQNAWLSGKSVVLAAAFVAVMLLGYQYGIPWIKRLFKTRSSKEPRVKKVPVKKEKSPTVLTPGDSTWMAPVVALGATSAIAVVQTLWRAALVLLLSGALALIFQFNLGGTFFYWFFIAASLHVLVEGVGFAGPKVFDYTKAEVSAASQAVLERGGKLITRAILSSGTFLLPNLYYLGGQYALRAISYITKEYPVDFRFAVRLKNGAKVVIVLSLVLEVYDILKAHLAVLAVKDTERGQRGLLVHLEDTLHPKVNAAVGVLKNFEELQKRRSGRVDELTEFEHQLQDALGKTPEFKLVKQPDGSFCIEAEEWGLRIKTLLYKYSEDPSGKIDEAATKREVLAIKAETWEDFNEKLSDLFPAVPDNVRMRVILLASDEYQNETLVDWGGLDGYRDIINAARNLFKKLKS